MSLPFPPLQTSVIGGDERLTPHWLRWIHDLYNAVKPTGVGFSGTITTAKLTGGGANGSMTFVNGVLTAQVPAT